MMADRYAPAPKPRSPTRRDALKKIVLRLPTWSGQFWLSWPGCLAFTYGRILRLAARSARNSSRSSMTYSTLLHPKAIARESHLLNPRPTKFQTEVLPVSWRNSAPWKGTGLRRRSKREMVCSRQLMLTFGHARIRGLIPTRHAVSDFCPRRAKSEEIQGRIYKLPG
jgi:hypothetical protein